MLKFIFFLSTSFLIIACNSSTNTKGVEDERSSTAKLSLEPFADSLVRLDIYTPEGIERAAQYFESLVPGDSTLADSAAVMLLIYMNRIVDTANKKLYKDTANYFNLAYGGGEPLSEKEKALKRQLASHHLNLQGDGEGGALIVLDHHWVADIVQPKTSTAVDEYLLLLAEEESNPALLDAAVAIDLKDLVARLISSEKLFTQKLPYRFSEDVVVKNKFYTNALLLGSNNSPSLEYNSTTLTPEFKDVYSHLLAKYPASKAAQKVKQWIAIINARDKKKIDEMREAAYQ